MKTALLFTTYNWPDALQLVLESLLNQSQLPDEVLIADDGSRAETKEIITRYASKLAVPVKHIWQEDLGFRKSEILNKAVAASTSDYIVQIDGDCIMHKDFIKDHISSAEKNTYLYGSRVNILPNAVNAVMEHKIINFSLFSKEIKNKTRAIHFPLFAGFYKSHAGISKKFRGCNVSYWKSDFIAVNGYNEAFQGWGREDSDLAIRLGNSGVMAKRLRYMGIVFHIHHNINSKENLEANDRIQKETIKNKVIRADKGVDQYFSI